MRTITSHRRSLAIGLVLASFGALLAVWWPAHAAHATAARAAAKPKPKPTIVLVHGAFADAGTWAPIATELQHQGYTVVAPANPLQGVKTDAAYVRGVLHTIKGPIVLVGHSYGGMVITNAATGDHQVKALVYVAAYAPEQGESASDLEKLAPGGGINPKILNIVSLPKPDGNGKELDAFIKPSVFHQIFAEDLPMAESDELAASQRPLALSALTDKSGPPAWKSIPSWYIVGGEDHTIGTQVEQIMAKRIHAHTSEIPTGSHLLMLSHPTAVTKVIETASHSVG